MADNFVQIRIKATDTAKPDLDDLRADLDDLGTKVDTAKVDVDDEDAKRKLLEINAALAELNKRVANPKIDSAGAARAEARVEKLKKDFSDLVEKVDSSNRSSHGLGLLNKLLFGEGGGAGGEGAAGGEGGGGGLAGLLPDGAILPVIAGIVPVAEAALVEVTGLVSGLAAAGGGAAAFALLAAPAFEKVKGAIGDTHAELMKLNPDERGAVYGIRELEHSLDRMSKAFEPDAFKVFNEGLKVANQLLPLAKPFADTFARSLDGLLGQLDKFTKSTGFRDWLAQFQKLEGPSVHAIGEGIGKIGTAIGQLLSTMSAKDVVHSINIAFDILSGTIRGLAWAVRGAMRSWDQLSSAFRHTRRDLASDAHDIAHAFDQMRHDVAAAVDWVVQRVSQDTDHMRTDLVHWAQDVGHDTSVVVHFFEQLPGRILGALASLPGRLFSLGAHIISMLADGIRSAIGDVTGAIGSVASEILSHIPMSPAKKGPLSGRGDPRLAGQRISRYLAQGMTDGIGAVDAAADRVAGAARLGGRGGNAGGQLQVVLEFHPPAGAAVLGSEFWTAFANGVRVRGGSPQIVTRKVAFR